MINYDDVTKENINKRNLNWPRITDYLYRILEALDLEKRTHLVKQQDDDGYSIINKIYLHVEDPYESKS